MIIQPFTFISGFAGGDFCGGNQGLTVTTSTGSVNTSYQPIYGLYDYSLTLTIFTQSQLGIGQKLLRSIAWDLEGWRSGAPYNNLTNQTIKLAHVTESSVDTGIDVDDILNEYNVSDLTTVYQGAINYANDGSAFAEVVDFDTNFCYNGSSNLMMIAENRYGDWTSSYGRCNGIVGGGGTIAWANDGSFPTNADSTQLNSYDDQTPNTRFGY